MLKIRASILPSYQDCPRRYAARLVGDKIKELGYDVRTLQPSIGAAVGTGFHATASHLMTCKLTGEITTLDAGIEIGIVGMREEIANGVTFDSTTATKNEAEKQIIRISQSFASEVAPQITPKTVEISYPTAAMGDLCELTGHSDTETVDDIICDWKSGVTIRPHQAQMGEYSLLRRTSGHKTKGLRVYHLPRVAVKKPYPGAKVYEYDVAMAERTAYAVIRYILRDVKNFEATNDPQAFPANPMSMLCSEKYCPVFGTAFCELREHDLISKAASAPESIGQSK